MLTQEEVKKYWNKSACNYSNSIKRELEDGSADVWKELILDNAPPNREKLDILDIGTGPGFFSIIMAQEGHRPVGIDGSPEMLKQANINAQLTGVDVEFRQMNVHELDFPDNTFDMVISRNGTWTLYDPRKDYAEWKRVLRSGGRILVFDASWYASLFDAF